MFFNLLSSSGSCEIVQALLCKGAYVDALTTAGAALHFAAHNGRDDIVKVLLDHHADVRASPSQFVIGLFHYLVMFFDCPINHD